MGSAVEVVRQKISFCSGNVTSISAALSPAFCSGWLQSSGSPRGPTAEVCPCDVVVLEAFVAFDVPPFHCCRVFVVHHEA